MKNAKKA
jgi:hypothetical protein